LNCDQPLNLPLPESFSLDQPIKLEEFFEQPLTNKPFALLSLPFKFNDLVLNSIKFKANLTSAKEMVSLHYVQHLINEIMKEMR
jgi:hypothetical protein